MLVRHSYRRGVLVCGIWLIVLGLPWVVIGAGIAREAVADVGGWRSMRFWIGIAIGAGGFVHGFFAYGIMKTQRWAFIGGIAIFILWCAGAGLTLILLATFNSFIGEACALALFLLNAAAFDRLATAKMMMDKRVLWQMAQPHGFEPILNQQPVSNEPRPPAI